MSVAIIVDTFPRWSERFIARELNELQRRGLEFTIYCLRAGDVECEADPEFSGLIHRRVVLPSCFLPSFARELGMDAAAKERLRLVEQELGVTAFRQIGCADTLTKLIREHRHEIVYAHFASLPSTLGWLAAESLKLPLVISCHARDVFVDAQMMREKIEYARRIFVCNEAARETLSRRWFYKDQLTKLVLAPHGLPLERYNFLSDAPRNKKSDFQLLAAGRFVHKKGFEILIEALAVSELKALNVKLTILGDGPNRGLLTRRTRKLNLNERISFPGVVFNSELRQHFQAADAFVMPSINVENDGDSDGVPNVLLEAFALGVPVIGTNAGSLRDVLSTRTGFIIEGAAEKQSRPNMIAAAIQEALLTQDEAMKRSAYARKVIEYHYDIRKNIVPLSCELTIP